MNDGFLTYLNELESRAAEIERRQISQPWYLFAALIVGGSLFILAYSSAWHALRFVLPAAFALALVAIIAGPPYSLKSWHSRRSILMAVLRRRVFDEGMLADYLRKRAEPGEKISAANGRLLERFIAYFMGETYAESMRHGYGNPNEGDNPLLRAALLLMLSAELRQGYELFDEDAGTAHEVSAADVDGAL